MAIPSLSTPQIKRPTVDDKPKSAPATYRPPPPAAKRFSDGFDDTPRANAGVGGNRPKLVLNPEAQVPVQQQPLSAGATLGVQQLQPQQQTPTPEIDLTGLRDSDRADYHDQPDTDLYAFQVGANEYTLYDVNGDGKLTPGVDQIQDGKAPRDVTADDIQQVQPMVLAASSDAARQDWVDNTFSPFAQDHGVTLTADERQGILDLPPEKFAMFAYTQSQQEQVADAEITPADYTFNVMDYAASMANTGEQYVDLVGFAFSEPENQGQSGSNQGSTIFNSTPSFMEWGRRLLGGGADPVGSVLERLNKSIVPEVDAFAEDGHSTGFLDPVRDDLGADGHWMDGGSTIAHHLGEFLQVGAAMGADGAGIAQAAQDFIDDGNYGDVRSGYFNIMIGGALTTPGANQNVLGPGSGNVISPRDAAALTRWAYTDPAAASLWPADPASGNESDLRSAFDLNTWVNAYNEAHPDAQIALNQ